MKKIKRLNLLREKGKPYVWVLLDEDIYTDGKLKEIKR